MVQKVDAIYETKENTTGMENQIKSIESFLVLRTCVLGIIITLIKPRTFTRHTHKYQFSTTLQHSLLIASHILIGLIYNNEKMLYP